jgi:IQ domain-containing protein G
MSRGVSAGDDVSFGKLSPIESERIVAIIEDTTEKLDFLDSITPDVLQHRDELSKFIGDEISKTMAEQKVLEKRYEALIEERASMKGMVNKQKYKEVQDEIQDVSRALKESTNNLVRNLKENPNVSGNMIKVQRDRVELRDLLLRCSQELRDRGTYHTVTFKVDEENNARIRFQQLKSREKGLREVVQKLQHTLNEEQESFLRTTVEQKQAISQLKDELQVMKGSTSTDTRYKKKESVSSVSAIWREYKLKERTLELRLKELEDRFKTENVVHAETKEFLEKKHVGLADDITSWESKYEKDIGDLNNELETLSSERNDMLIKLNILRERKKKEIEAINARKEQEDLEIELEKQRKHEQRRQNNAAKKIQREMQNWFKRRKESGGNKKGKGGKNGGGKKKKKK